MRVFPIKTVKTIKKIYNNAYNEIGLFFNETTYKISTL